MDDDEAMDVIHRAERIVYATSWRAQEEIVLQRMSGISGLACAWLEPRSGAIQLVTYDGEHLGHIRRVTQPGSEECWVAVLKDPVNTVGWYSSPAVAAHALAQAAGKQTPKAG